MSTSFARDYHMTRRASRRPGTARSSACSVDVLADHGAFNGTAQPTKFPAGFFHIFTGSYDLQAAHCKVKGVYTNKAPGGVAYACSFRITEAVYLVERMVDCLAAELEMDPAELRMKNLLRPEQFPYTSQDRVGVRLRRVPARAAAGDGDRRATTSCAASRPRSASPRRADGHRHLVLHRGRRRRARASTWTSSGLGMADGCELRVHPTGKAQVRLSVQTQGQGHETTFAQIVVAGARHPARGHRGHPRRHRQHPVRPGHLRVPLHAGVRRGRGRRGATGPGQGEDHRGGRARVSRRGPGVGATGRWQVKGDPEQGRTIAGDRDAQRTATLDAARGRRGPPGRVGASTTRRT